MDDRRLDLESVIVLSSSMTLRSLLGRFQPTISAMFEAVLRAGRAIVGHFSNFPPLRPQPV